MLHLSGQLRLKERRICIEKYGRKNFWIRRDETGKQIVQQNQKKALEVLEDKNLDGCPGVCAQSRNPARSANLHVSGPRRAPMYVKAALLRVFRDHGKLVACRGPDCALVYDSFQPLEPGARLAVTQWIVNVKVLAKRQL